MDNGETKVPQSTTASGAYLAIREAGAMSVLACWLKMVMTAASGLP
jgi:hypothetical protein